MNKVQKTLLNFGDSILFDSIIFRYLQNKKKLSLVKPLLPTFAEQHRLRPTLLLREHAKSFKEKAIRHKSCEKSHQAKLIYTSGMFELNVELWVVSLTRLFRYQAVKLSCGLNTYYYYTQTNPNN